MRSARAKVVIIGGGFAGLAAARALRTAPADVVVIDRANHHLFQPLLYQVATATLPPTDITAPIRWLLRKQRNTSVLMAVVADINLAERTVRLASGNAPTEIRFDYLILAAGSTHSYFGKTDWERFAPGLKSLSDALHIRSQFLMAFENAEWEPDPVVRKEMQTFVIVGGGPTGVELAGILPEIAKRAMRHDFRVLNPGDTRVVLIEAGPRVLPTFTARTSMAAERDLAALGVEVRTGARVTDIGADYVRLGNETIRARTIIWAAGNHASGLARTMGVPTDAHGRIRVEPDMSVPGHENVFVAGDLAVVVQEGAQLDGVAQVAIQGGRAAARNIARSLRGEPRKPFRYQNRGVAATIGRNRAVVEMGPLVVSGRPAWFFWLFLHLLYLAGFRNRLSVLLEWAYAYFSFQRGARLITGEGQTTPPPVERQRSSTSRNT